MTVVVLILKVRLSETHVHNTHAVLVTLPNYKLTSRTEASGIRLGNSLTVCKGSIIYKDN
mgnify:CR=1 FL=1